MAQERITYEEDGTLDEIVLGNAWVHLEHLGDGTYMLILENDEAHVHLTIQQPNPDEVQIGDRYSMPGTTWRRAS